MTSQADESEIYVENDVEKMTGKAKSSAIVRLRKKVEKQKKLISHLRSKLMEKKKMYGDNESESSVQESSEESSKSESE